MSRMETYRKTDLEPMSRKPAGNRPTQEANNSEDALVDMAEHPLGNSRVRPSPLAVHAGAPQARVTNDHPIRRHLTRGSVPARNRNVATHGEM